MRDGSEALNSMTAERTDELMNDVNKDIAQQLHDQLSTERITHQQLVSSLEQQLAHATAVRIEACMYILTGVC